MSAREQQGAAKTAARRSYKDLTRRVYRRAARLNGREEVSSWLRDHAGRANKGVKLADQLGRLAIEMQGAGYTRDELNQEITSMAIDIADKAIGATLAA